MMIHHGNLGVRSVVCTVSNGIMGNHGGVYIIPVIWDTLYSNPYPTILQYYLYIPSFLYPIFPTVSHNMIPSGELTKSY